MSEVLARDLTEKQLSAHIVRLAQMLGYLVYHTYDSRRSARGFPDLVLVHVNRPIIFAELKSERGRVSPDQQNWLDRLAEQAAVYVWRPSNWYAGEIEKVLR